MNYTSKSSVVAYDNLGNPVTLDTYFSKTGTNTWQVDVYNDAAPGTPLTTQTLNFNPANGNLTAASPQALSIAIPGGNSISLNIASMTQGFVPSRFRPRPRMATPRVSCKASV
jgi:flagellar hook protein FlgE